MSNKPKVKKIYKVVGGVAICWGLFMGGAIMGSYTAQKAFEIKDPYLRKIIASWDLIQKRSVLDTEDPNVNEKLMDNALKSLAGSIDSHSTWNTERETKKIFEKLSGEYVGIGISYQVSDKGGVIIKVFTDSPLDKLGVVPGDIITKIEDKKIIAKINDNGERVIFLNDKIVSENDLSDLLRGKEGTKVNLTLKRQSSGKEETFSVNRSKIMASNVQSEIKDLGEQGQWLRISVREFQENTLNEVAHRIRSLWAFAKNEHIQLKGVVLDLQDSPGGIVPVSISMASLFLPENKTVVTLLQKNEKPDVLKTYTLNQEPWSDWLKKSPLVVWSSKRTASAAEILLGGLKENNRIKFILGDETYGKGVVQTVYKIDKDSLAISSGWYTTPTGNYIQGHGIKPDYKIIYPEKIEKEINKIGEKFSHNYLAPPVEYKEEGKIIDSFKMEATETWNEKNVIDWYWNTTKTILDK